MQALQAFLNTVIIVVCTGIFAFALEKHLEDMDKKLDQLNAKQEQCECK